MGDSWCGPRSGTLDNLMGFNFDGRIIPRL